jgi:hypothetical protein
MKVIQSYIQGRVLGFMGRSGGWHFNLFESDKLKVGDIVKYPTSDCRFDETTGNVIVISYDEYGQSALVLADPVCVTEESDLWKYDDKTIESHFGRTIITEGSKEEDY